MASYYTSDFDRDSLSLTTIFTPPASCRTHWTYEAATYNDIPGGLLMQNVFAAPIDSDCFPSGYSKYGRGSISQIYSPGHCPHGYSTPAQFVNGATTTLVCCPTSFSYSTTLTTIDNITPTTTMIFAGCISTFPSASGSTLVPARGPSELLVMTTVAGPITMWAQPIEVAFQKRDLAFYTTSTTPLSTPLTRTATPASQAQPSSNPITQGAVTATSVSPSPIATSLPRPDNGLSPGAKAGIGAGAAAVGTFLIALLIFLIWRRRQRARAEEQRVQEAITNFQDPKEKGDMCLEETKEISPPVELEHSIRELDSNARVEMPDRHDVPIAEMC